MLLLSMAAWFKCFIFYENIKASSNLSPKKFFLRCKKKLDAWLFGCWNNMVHVTWCNRKSKFLSLNMKKCLKSCSSFCFACIASIIFKAVWKHQLNIFNEFRCKEKYKYAFIVLKANIFKQRVYLWNCSCFYES